MGGNNQTVKLKELRRSIFFENIHFVEKLAPDIPLDGLYKGRLGLDPNSDVDALYFVLGASQPSV